jgi:Ran GTPase-activating protein (RanGAP) involved in mRNA processing and transport
MIACDHVIGNHLRNIRRQSLTLFLDLISLQSLASISRAELAQRQHYISECKSLVLNTQQCRDIPKTIVEQIQSNTLLQIVCITAPFTLEIVEGYASESILKLDMHNMVSTETLPLLLKIVQTQPKLRVLALANSDLAGKITGGTVTTFSRREQMATLAAKGLTAVIGEAAMLTELDVSNCEIRIGFGFGVVKGIASSLSQNSTLMSLKMSNNYIACPQSGKLLSTALLQNSTLTNFDASSNANFYGSNGAGFVEELLICLNQNTALCILNLSGNNTKQWSPSQLQLPVSSALGAVVGAALATNTMLRELDLSFNRLKPEFMQDFAAGLGSNETLKKLGLSGNHLANRIAGEELAEALARNSTLQTLDLSGNIERYLDGAAKSTGGQFFVQVLSPGLTANESLLSCNILGNGIVIDQAHTLMLDLTHSTTKLSSLCGFSGKEDTEKDLSRAGLSNGCAVIIASELRHNMFLSRLDLSGNSIKGVSAGKALGDALSENNVLKDLDLSNNQCGVDFIQAFSRGLRNNAAMHTLLLSKNNLMTKEAGKALSGILAANTSLKRLDISDNFNQCKAATDSLGFTRELSIGLISNSSLESLALAMNGILNRETGQVLSEMLAVNSSLTELSVSHNYATTKEDDGRGFASALSSGLHSNSSLTSVDLGGNHIAPEQEKRLSAPHLL